MTSCAMTPPRRYWRHNETGPVAREQLTIARAHALDPTI